MNFLQIQYFLTVANFGNVTQAAEDLHVSQPAVSKQLGLLESDLDIQLFRKEGRKIVLTPGGKAMYDFFNHFYTELANTKKLAQQLNQQNLNDKIKAQVIIFIDWDSSLFITPMLGSIFTNYPSIEIEVENRGIFDIAATINDPRIDVVMCFDHLVPENLKNAVEHLHVADVHRTVFYSRRNELAQRDSIKFTDFKDYTCYALRSPKHPEPERSIRAICTQYGFEPKFSFKPNHDSVIMAVQSGRGYCILDEWSRQYSNPDFKSLNLDFTRSVSLYWRRDNQNKAVPVIVQALQDALENGGAAGAILPVKEQEFHVNF